MAWDNYTPTTVRALKVCPQGQQPGEVFDVTRDVADVLVTAEVVEIVEDKKSTEKKPRANPPAGEYNRRDLTAKS